jgi:hypothetical protein
MLTINNPIIFFKYHNKNIDKIEYEYINNLINIAIEHNNEEFKTSNYYNYSQYNCDIIVNSNLYSNEPKIISTGGFSFLQAGMILNIKSIEETQGNWNNLLNPNTDSFRAITTSSDPRSYYGSVFPTTAIEFDNIPICFSFPILPSSVDSTQFLLKLNNNIYVKPLTFSFSPNSKFNEKQCIVVCGYFNNKITIGPNAIYPVSLEIVESSNGKKMMAVGPNGLYDMTGKTINCSNPYTEPLKISLVILTKYNLTGIYNYLGDIGCGINQIEEKNSPYELYGNDAEYRIRIFTKGGYSPNGITSMFPDSYENYFYLQHKNPITDEITELKKSNFKYLFNNGTKYVEIIGLADLGIKQPQYNQKYIEDHDNQIDIVLKGNKSVIKNIINLVIPSNGKEYTKFYNPGGPGPTPFENITYTIPSEYQIIDIINNLENPNTVSWINTHQKL